MLKHGMPTLLPLKPKWPLPFLIVNIALLIVCPKESICGTPNKRFNFCWKNKFFMFCNVTLCTNVHMVQFVWSCILTICKDLGENILCPQKLIVTKKILHLGFFGTCGHHILDYFCSFQVYCISFRLELVYFKRNFNKHLWTWTYQVYLCWNKYVKDYEKLQTYFKTKVTSGIL
jgi:hypothetical protein